MGKPKMKRVRCMRCRKMSVRRICSACSEINAGIYHLPPALNNTGQRRKPKGSDLSFSAGHYESVSGTIDLGDTESPDIELE